MADQITVDRIDEGGVHLRSREDLVVDVRFDGRRIWSFWTLRDSIDGLAAWPPQLRRFLDGSTRLAVVEHVSGRTVLDQEHVVDAAHLRAVGGDDRGAHEVTQFHGLLPGSWR